MSTRLRVAATAPAVTPTVGSWDVTAGADVATLTAATVSTAADFATAASVSTANVLVFTAVSDPLPAQVIHGTFVGYMLAKSTTTSRSMVRVKVVSGDGATTRGVLVEPTYEATSSAWTSTYTNKRFPGLTAAAVTPVEVQAGDRIVIEVGTRYVFASALSRTATIQAGGGTAGDLPTSGTVSTAMAGWFEFSQDLFPGDNDNFADASELTDFRGSVTGAMIASTSEVDEPGVAGASLWYDLAVPYRAEENTTTFTLSSTFEGALEAYASTSSGVLTGAVTDLADLQLRGTATDGVLELALQSDGTGHLYLRVVDTVVTPSSQYHHRITDGVRVTDEVIVAVGDQVLILIDSAGLRDRNRRDVGSVDPQQFDDLDMSDTVEVVRGFIVDSDTGLSDAVAVALGVAGSDWDASELWNPAELWDLSGVAGTLLTIVENDNAGLGDTADRLQTLIITDHCGLADYQDSSAHAGIGGATGAFTLDWSTTFEPGVRFYFGRQSTNFMEVSTVPYGDGWDYTADVERHDLELAPFYRPFTDDAQLIITNVTTAAAANVLMGQFVSDPMEAQTFEGTFMGQVYAFGQSSPGSTYNQLTQVRVSVVSNDGTVERGVLHDPVAPVSTDYLNNTSALTDNHRLPADAPWHGVPVDPVEVEDGDRLLVEIGVYVAAATTITQAFINIDKRDTDLSVDDFVANSTTTSWVEFSTRSSSDARPMTTSPTPSN